MSVDQAVDRFGRLAEIGIDGAIVSAAGEPDEAWFELVAEVVGQVGPIPVAGH